MTRSHGTCRVCGLRIIERVGGWEHMATAAGRTQEADHEAEPQR